MTRPPKLTIAIPTLNRADLVKHAIDCALSQTLADIEIIVSNNGSTDKTRSILEQYSDPRLKIFHHNITMDVCSHGNFLIGNATGELFLGLSDDDLIEPMFAERVVEFLTRHPDASFIYTGCDIHYADIAVPALVGPEIESGSAFLTAFLKGQRNVCWCACVSRTKDLKSIGDIPPESICGDMFFWVKLAAQGPVGCVRETLSHYFAFRDNVQNHSTGTTIKAWVTEVERLVKSIETTIYLAPMKTTDHASISRHGREFLARSTADQFIWNRLRGVSRTILINALLDCMNILQQGNPMVWLRPLAAILAPRRLLRHRVLAAAVRKARRSNGVLK